MIKWKYLVEIDEIPILILYQSLPPVTPICLDKVGHVAYTKTWVQKKSDTFKISLL